MDDMGTERRRNAIVQAEHRALVAEDELNIAAALGTDEDRERATEKWQTAQGAVHRLALQAE